MGIGIAARSRRPQSTVVVKTASRQLRWLRLPRLQSLAHLSGARGRGGYFLPVLVGVDVFPFSCLVKGEVAGGAAFGFSFFGFFASRLPRCSRVAIARS